MALLDKIVRLNFPGKKHISRVGMPLIAVAKIKKKHFLEHLMLFLMFSGLLFFFIQ